MSICNEVSGGGYDADLTGNGVAPPWEVVLLVAQSLKPKELAVASCVCKTWLYCFSSDIKWEGICREKFPSILNLKERDSTLMYKTLFSLGLAAEKRRRQPPPKPTLCSSDLVFSILILSMGNQKIGSLWISGEELETGEHALFQYEVVLGQGNGFGIEKSVKEGEKLKVVWNVVLKGWKGVFNLMECEGKIGAGGEGWFSAKVGAVVGCCCRGMEAGSGLMADLRLGFSRVGDGEKMKVAKVNMGLLSTVSWRYVCLDDALRYLQHFL